MVKADQMNWIAVIIVAVAIWLVFRGMRASSQRPVSSEVPDSGAGRQNASGITVTEIGDACPSLRGGTLVAAPYP